MYNINYIQVFTYKYIQYIKKYKYIHRPICVCIYIYIINIHSTHTYSMQTQTFILNRLIVINRFAAQVGICA